MDGGPRLAPGLHRPSQSGGRLDAPRSQERPRRYREYLTFLSAFNRRDLVTAFAVLAPNCEFRTPPDMPGHQVLLGREHVIAFFEQAFEVLPDWYIESVRILQEADDVFVALDQGRVSGRSGDAPTVQEIATVSELRDSMVIRVQQYTSWEEGLRAAGLDPSMSAHGLNRSGQMG